MRVVSFSLNMRPGFPPNDEQTTSVPTDRLLKVAEGPPTYTSLLGTKPWEPPTGLSSTGLPATPRLVTPESKEFHITPDTLRFFSSKVDEIVTRIHGVESAYRQTNARSELQQEELHRQEAKVAEIRALLGDLRGARQDRIDARTRAIEAGQQALLARLNRVLAELMNQANPTLSDHETKWFDELGRMREQVLGAGKYDEASLKARVQAVRIFLLHLPHFFSSCVHNVMLTLGVTKAETGVRPAAAPFEIAEREGAGTSKEHAGKESGTRRIPSVRDWSTIQQRVRPFCLSL